MLSFQCTTYMMSTFAIPWSPNNTSVRISYYIRREDKKQLHAAHQMKTNVVWADVAEVCAAEHVWLALFCLLDPLCFSSVRISLCSFPSSCPQTFSWLRLKVRSGTTEIQSDKNTCLPQFQGLCPILRGFTRNSVVAKCSLPKGCVKIWGDGTHFIKRRGLLTAGMLYA